MKMQITPVQTSNTAAINTQNQLYSQIAGLKNKDPKANAAQIAQLTQQLNSSLGQTQARPVAQAQPVEIKSPIKAQASPTGSSTGTIVDAKA